MGDKGDGSAASREEAKQRQKYLNAHHIPDVIRFGGRIEIKCYPLLRLPCKSSIFTKVTK